MLGKPFVCIVLSSPTEAFQRDLSPPVWQRSPLLMPFLNRSVLFYSLRRCRQAGIDTALLLLDQGLYAQRDSLKLLMAGLPMKIECLPYAEQDLWQARLEEQMNQEDPVLLLQNPAMDLLPLKELLSFHSTQQADCSLRLSPVAGPLAQRIWLDQTAQLSAGQTPVYGYDTRCYLLEPDIFEELLQQPVNLMQQPLLPAIQQAAQYISGLLSENLWLEWQQAQDYFDTQGQILRQGLLEPVHQRKLKQKHATVWIGEEVLIAPDVSFSGPVVLGEQVSLAEGVHIAGPALIGAHSQIQAHSRIESSWLWPGCEVGRESQIRNSWLGEKVVIQPGSRLDGLWAGDHSHIGLPEALPPGTCLGPHSHLDMHISLEETQ